MNRQFILANRLVLRVALLLLVACCSMDGFAQAKKQEPIVLSVNPPHIKTDKTVVYDYDIVYVRGLRRTDGKEARWAEFSRPTMMEPGANLMLLHPDGKEEVLVDGAEGSVMDPYVSFDGKWVYYAKFIDERHTGSDI